MRRHIENGRVIEAYSFHEVMEDQDPSQRSEPARTIDVDAAKAEGDRYRRISLDYAGLD